MIKNRKTKSFSKNQHSFAVAQPGVNRDRSTFDRPSRTTTAIDGGYIYPIYIDEVLPGDTFQMRSQLKGWLATPTVPFLDNLYLDTFYFFVPNRLVWENWQKFQGEKVNPGDTTTYTVPQMSILGGASTGAGKLADFMGIPTIATTFEVNAMPFRGYNLIWNEFFRDTNLQDSVTVDRDDANSDEADYVLMKRGRRKDYLSGCLPFAQRGDAVELSLGTSAPVVPTTSGIPEVLIGVGNQHKLIFQIADPGPVKFDAGSFPSGDEDVKWVVSGLETDLSAATASTVNELRQSIAIQQLLELDARGGARYTEQLKARFGVTSADQRLQRPEFLGGGHSNISVTPVPATTENSNLFVGHLAAFGHVDSSGGGFTHSFTEHGFVIGLVSLRADYTYQEGVPRMWTRQTRYEYYEPALAHLGEQPVYNQEIFVSNDANDLLVWGYQERSAEYKYGNSMLTSILRSDHPIPIDFWTLAQHFQTLPTLGDTFIQENPPIDRVISTPSEPHLVLDCYFSNRCTRVMPVFNTPGLTRF